jgi:probable phosphoglycerate mutase
MNDTPPSTLRVIVNIDGGAKGNPGPAAAGVVIRDAADNQVIYEAGLFLGVATNNVAEYRGLLAGLETAAKLGAGEVEVISDSELLVHQMNGVYRVKNAGLKPLHEQAQTLRTKFSRCTIRHVRREYNECADRLVNLAVRRKRNVEGAAEQA